MSFMNLYTTHEDFYLIETSTGTEAVPCDVAGHAENPSDLALYCEGRPESFERVTGKWFARYSAPGYMDCTSWCGPYATEKLAADACRDLFGDDEDENDAS